MKWHLMRMAVALCATATVSSALATPKCTFKDSPNTLDIYDTSYAKSVKSVVLPSGTTYRYIFRKPKTSKCSAPKPWLLFIHGFPSSSFDWRHQIDFFASKGYGIIAPDMLGYGGTDSPNDLAHYSLKRGAADLVELLDCEGISKVVVVGHDFGSPVVSRLTVNAPNRLTAVAFVVVGYTAPGAPLSQAGVEVVNNQTLEALGYPIFGYWYFMNDQKAGPTFDAHLDTAFTLIYSNNTTFFRENICPVGAAEKFLLADKPGPFGPWVTEKDKETWKRIFSGPGGFTGPTNWYKSMMRNFNADDDAAIPATAVNITVPVLLITATEDPISLPDFSINQTKPFAPDLRIRSVDAGHFAHMEKPVEVNRELQAFLDEVS